MLRSWHVFAEFMSESNISLYIIIKLGFSFVENIWHMRQNMSKQNYSESIFLLVKQVYANQNFTN